MVDQVVASIQALRFRYASEDQLQAVLEDGLMFAGYQVEREYRLDGFSRLDLFIGDPLDGPGVAIECKVAGSRDRVIRQIRRYVGYDQVGAIVLVTSRVRHVQIPTVIEGKPVRVVPLALFDL